MSEPPTPAQVYEAAEREGRRRLDMPALEQVSTGFIAGVTIVLGIVALGVVEDLARPAVGAQAAQLLGALGFGTGLVLLVVGRSELFSENFFDPVAAALRSGGRDWWRLLRLWGVVLALNLVGGAVLLGVVSVEGALPGAADQALVRVAEDIADKSAAATLARAVLAGALLTLLSFLLHAASSTGARIALAYLAGFLVAVGPFDHVVVSVLHLLFGVWEADSVTVLDVLRNGVTATTGNVVGGVLLMTLTHTAQVRARRG